MYRQSQALATRHCDISVYEAPVHANTPCIFLVDVHQRLIEASPAAYRLLASSAALRLVHDKLCTATALDDARLKGALLPLFGGQSSTRTLRLGEDEDKIELELIAMSAREGVPHVIATVRALADMRQRQVTHAAGRFGLTAAERRLLEILCQGCPMPQAASRLGVARTTARTHLQRIFDKSGARRQSDLQRLIFSPGAEA